MGQSHLEHLQRGLSGQHTAEDGLTRAGNGGQGRVCGDRGRHVPLEKWIECVNVGLDRSLSQIRRNAQQRSRQHGGR